LDTEGTAREACGLKLRPQNAVNQHMEDQVHYKNYCKGCDCDSKTRTTCGAICPPESQCHATNLLNLTIYRLMVISHERKKEISDISVSK
jgi:hypothetical protein